MADGTHIEWTDATWNPITGCSIVSPGCTNCYAMKLAGTRLQHHPSRAGLTVDSKSGPVWNGQVRFNEQWLGQPLRWTKPRRIFVCAHGDLFAEGVPDEWIDRVFAVMALAPQHTFQVLTKRAARMRTYFIPGERKLRNAWLNSIRPGSLPVSIHGAFARISMDATNEHRGLYNVTRPMWPLPNVWLGVSAEDQKRANERVPDLLHTPTPVRFVSAEPLLGQIDFRRVLVDHPTFPGVSAYLDALVGQLFDLGGTPIDGHWSEARLHQIILGGESGQNARPMSLADVRSIRDQCTAAGTDFFFKQWGNWLPSGQLAADGRPWSPLSGNSLHAIKAITGRLLDGVEHNAMPQVQP